MNGAGSAERGSRFTGTINAQIVRKTWTSAVRVSVCRVSPYIGYI